MYVYIYILAYQTCEWIWFASTVGRLPLLFTSQGLGPQNHVVDSVCISVLIPCLNDNILQPGKSWKIAIRRLSLALLNICVFDFFLLPETASWSSSSSPSTIETCFADVSVTPHPNHLTKTVSGKSCMNFGMLQKSFFEYPRFLRRTHPSGLASRWFSTETGLSVAECCSCSRPFCTVVDSQDMTIQYTLRIIDLNGRSLSLQYLYTGKKFKLEHKQDLRKWLWAKPFWLSEGEKLDGCSSKRAEML